MKIVGGASGGGEEGSMVCMGVEGALATTTKRAFRGQLKMYI